MVEPQGGQNLSPADRSGMGIRLPSRNDTRYWNGDDPEQLTQIANVRDLTAREQVRMAEYAELFGRLGLHQRRGPISAE